MYTASLTSLRLGFGGALSSGGVSGNGFFGGDGNSWRCSSESNGKSYGES